MSSSQSTRELFATAHHEKSEGKASSLMISVRSSPNLGCASNSISKHRSHIKERSFPPPLSHTLPRSASSDSFSYSVRACREDGRFVLKEVKVPCRQYFQASRKDGCLTLQRLTTDEDFESEHMTRDEAYKEREDSQEDDNVGVYEAIADVVSDKAKGGSCDKIEVESANTANLVGESEVCRVKGSKKSSNHVGVDNIDEKVNIMEEVGCLFADSLLMATLSNGSSCSLKNDKVNFISHGGGQIKSDFKAAKRKTAAGKASRLRRSSNREALLHLPGKSPKLIVGHDFDATKLSQCARKNLGLDSSKLSTRGVSNIGGGKILQGFGITSTASLRKSGYGISKSPSSSTTIIFKDVSAAKCLMENVSKLVASFGLENIGGKWSCGEEMKSRDGIMESSMYKGIKSINIGVREIESNSHESILFDECGFRCEAFREGKCVVGDTRLSCFLPSSLSHFDVQMPLSSASTDNRGAVQGKERLHTLHCKEIFDRNLAKGAFMKLHCVA